MLFTALIDKTLFSDTFTLVLNVTLRLSPKYASSIFIVYKSLSSGSDDNKCFV